MESRVLVCDGKVCGSPYSRKFSGEEGLLVMGVTIIF